jgi:hypothetical protein
MKTITMSPWYALLEDPVIGLCEARVSSSESRTLDFREQDSVDLIGQGKTPEDAIDNLQKIVNHGNYPQTTATPRGTVSWFMQSLRSVLEIAS